MKTSREESRTSDVPNAWPSKHPNEFAGRATIVTDWYHVSQGAIVLLYDSVEDVHQAVGSRTTAEDDDFPWIGSHCAYVEVHLIK